MLEKMGILRTEINKAEKRKHDCFCPLRFKIVRKKLNLRCIIGHKNKKYYIFHSVLITIGEIRFIVLTRAS